MIISALFFAVVACSYYNSDPPPFGKEMREKYFLLDPKAYILNHASFGGVPKPIYQSFTHFWEEMELNTDKWFRVGFKPYVKEVVKEISKYVNADEEDIVLLDNASEGVNTVLRSYPFKNTDTLLYISVEYPMTRNTISYVHERFGVSLLEVQLKLPIFSKEDVIQEIEKTLKEHPEITFAVFDHISSTPAIILPIKEMIDMCHKKNILVLVDGAHAVGQVHIDIKDLNPDFYLSNGHKWLLSPPGSSFLYVRKDLQDDIRAAIISCTFGKGYQADFAWQGTRDWSPRLAMLEAFKFREWLTDEKVMAWNDGLCEEVGYLFFKEWNTTIVVPFKEMTGSMVNVKLPCSNERNVKRCGEKCEFDWTIGEVSTKLQEQHIWVVLYELNGFRYLRISCQIYNEIGDYQFLMEKLNDFIDWKA